MCNSFMGSITLITFSFACWLAFYLIAHNNHPRLRLTGAGLLAYALVCGIFFVIGVDWVILRKISAPA